MPQLRKYQEARVRKICRLPKCMLADPMGAGKTATVVSAVEQLLAVGAANKVLVIAPKRVATDTWPAEIAKWSRLSYSVVVGPPKKRVAALEADTDVYCINYEGLMWLSEHLGSVWPFDMLVCDESSMLKHHGSNRSKAVWRAVKSGLVKRLVLLTGTPASNGIGDLWAQVRLLDNGARLYDTITAFREHWMEPVGNRAHNRWAVRGGNALWFAEKGRDSAAKTLAGAEARGDTDMVVRKQQEVAHYDANIANIRAGMDEVAAEITDAIKDICFSLSPEDLDEMPPVTYNNIEVTLPPKVLAQYKKFEADFLLQFPEGGASSPNAAAASSKCLQLASGAVYLDDTEREWAEVHTAKLDALGDVIEEACGAPVLVWYTFQSDRDRILKRFKKAKHIDDVDLEEWNRGRVPVMLAHPASASFGLNLQTGGHTSVWFSLTYNLEHKLQADKRLHRSGQTEHVFIHHLVAKGTLDADVLVRLEQKNDVQDRVLKQLEAA